MSEQLRMYRIFVCRRTLNFGGRTPSRSGLKPDSPNCSALSSRQVPYVRREIIHDSEVASCDAPIIEKDRFDFAKF
jgi:hypothetical protein